MIRLTGGLVSRLMSDLLNTFTDLWDHLPKSQIFKSFPAYSSLSQTYFQIRETLLQDMGAIRWEIRWLPGLEVFGFSLEEKPTLPGSHVAFPLDDLFKPFPRHLSPVSWFWQVWERSDVFPHHSRVWNLIFPRSNLPWFLPGSHTGNVSKTVLHKW